MCANPQKENGFTPTANEIEEALCRTVLSSYEHQVIHIVLRQTYGYHRKTWQLRRWRELEDFTGISKTHIQRTLAKLVERNIIELDAEKKEITFLKYYDKWIGYKPIEKVTQSGNFSDNEGEKKLPKQVTKKLPNQVTFNKKKLPKQVTQVTQSGNSTTSESAPPLDPPDPKDNLKIGPFKDNLKETLSLSLSQDHVPGTAENNSESESEEMTDEEFDQESYDLGRKLVEEFYPFYFTNNQGGLMNSEKTKLLINIGFAWNCYDPDLTRSVMAEVAGTLKQPSNLLAWVSERLDKIMKGEDDGKAQRSNGKR